MIRICGWNQSELTEIGTFGAHRMNHGFEAGIEWSEWKKMTALLYHSSVSVQRGYFSKL